MPCLPSFIQELLRKKMFGSAAPSFLTIRKMKSKSDTDTFEKYRDTPPISIAILLQKYALLLAESSIYTTNLYHDTPPIVSRCFCRSIGVRGRWNTPNATHAKERTCSSAAQIFATQLSAISKPVVWGTRGLHPGFPWLRWPDSRESIRRFARIARFSRIVVPEPNPLSANRALQGAKTCESPV